MANWKEIAVDWIVSKVTGGKITSASILTYKTFTSLSGLSSNDLVCKDNLLEAIPEVSGEYITMIPAGSANPAIIDAADLGSVTSIRPVVQQWNELAISDLYLDTDGVSIRYQLYYTDNTKTELVAVYVYCTPQVDDSTKVEQDTYIRIH